MDVRGTQPRVVILMGVSGAGKTAVGHELAAALGWEFHDADDLHPAANKRKMHAGVPLTDQDREPWLRAVRALIDRLLAAGRRAVIACSALKQSYRDLLMADPATVRIVYLRGTMDLIAARLEARPGHFMNPHLLRSQFDTLEEPSDALSVDISPPVAQIAAQIRERLNL